MAAVGVCPLEGPLGFPSALYLSGLLALRSSCGVLPLMNLTYFLITNVLIWVFRLTSLPSYFKSATKSQKLNASQSQKFTSGNLCTQSRGPHHQFQVLTTTNYIRLQLVTGFPKGTGTYISTRFKALICMLRT